MRADILTVSLDLSTSLAMVSSGNFVFDLRRGPRLARLGSNGRQTLHPLIRHQYIE
jgi:hypothetical protein